MEPKSFDAVRCMRDIRDALSREFQGLSFEEQRRRLDEARTPRESRADGALIPPEVSDKSRSRQDG